MDNVPGAQQRLPHPCLHRWLPGNVASAGCRGRACRSLPWGAGSRGRSVPALLGCLRPWGTAGTTAFLGSPGGIGSARDCSLAKGCQRVQRLDGHSCEQLLLAPPHVLATEAGPGQGSGSTWSLLARPHLVGEIKALAIFPVSCAGRCLGLETRKATKVAQARSWRRWDQPASWLQWGQGPPPTSSD